MAITLSVSDPGQVSSPSSLEVLLGEPAQRLIIFSGIAIPRLWTNHDEEVKRDEIVVRLGVHVAMLERGVVHIGLASIANDETNFLFALDTAQLKVEPGTGELSVHVAAAILGEHTSIHRFGYQGVAQVRVVRARISGSIAVSQEVLTIEGMPDNDVAALFEITANRIEVIPPPGNWGFAMEKLIPVAVGRTGRTRTSDEAAFVDYTIDGCPFNLPLRVDVQLRGRLGMSNVAVGQVRGPRPVLLTNTEPDASGVDFAVGRLPDIR